MLPESSLPHLILARAAAAPEAIAIRSAGRSLSYRELHLRAAAMAARLRDCGVGVENRVALLASPHPETIVTILAIHFAGAAYVPLDPTWPPAVFAHALRDSGAALLIGLAAELTDAPTPALPTLASDQVDAPATPLDEIAPCGPDAPAYIIFTSGSTGGPKGVLVTHGNLSHSTQARFTLYDRPPERFLLTSSLAFDSSVAGLFWTLASGGTLVLPTREERDPARLAALVERQKPTHTLCLPSLHARLLRTQADLSSLHCVIIAGEACPPTLPAAHAARLPHTLLWNEYGPTEATVWATVAPLSPPPATITIGTPIVRTDILLLDEHGIPVADGEEGEIHITGPGVASGYLNRPELTAERFIDDGPGRRRFRTGDLARRLPDGSLEFLGRLDRQVKLRGHRIELTAIEATLQSHPALSAAAVVLREDTPGEPRLVAYIVPVDAPIPAINRALSRQLPAPMQPSAYVALSVLPQTPNGKVDYAALPAPSRERPALDTTYAAPADALERHLAAEWSSVLALDRIGTHDRFFDLGGDSLRAAEICARLQQTLGEPVYIAALFEAPTVARLARHLRQHYPAAIERHFGATEKPAATREFDHTTIDRVRTLVARTPRDFPAARRLSRRTIFILAPPRSGTTLLRAMLARHPQLFTCSEAHLLGYRRLTERHAALGAHATLWRRSLIDAITRAKGCRLDEAEHLLATYERLDLGTGEFFALLQQWLGDRLLVDKSPSYALDPACLTHAETLFEDAFYIHLTRDPYEVVRSFAEHRMDQIYVPGAGDLTPRATGEAVWCLAHENIRSFLAAVPAHRHCEVRFSDLVQHPREPLEALCRALDLPFDAAMLDPYADLSAPAENGPHTADDPRFFEHRALKPEIAQRWRAAATDDFLSESTWQLAATLGYERPAPVVAAPVAEEKAPEPLPDDAIAIVGLGGRFPGARTVEEFWRNLCDGVESLRPFSEDELRASGVDPAVLADPAYVNRGGQIDDADHFAASFFGYTPREAELMDPQQRIFLECAWEALEHAGCDITRFPGAVGVFAGVALNDYFQLNLATRPELAPLLGSYPLTIGNEKDFVATRVAHKLNLRGPAISVQTACSTSLVALHLACQSLRSGDCDMALVGGGRISVPLYAGYHHVDGSIPSPDGRCRAFDAQAQGCVPSSGMAVVVIKRLADARREGDRIFSVIRGTAINNDGSAKAGFTAPSVDGQAAAIAQAHRAARVTADTIGYVEAHGTGTSLGDPIEIAGLTRAFRQTTDATGFCRLGSVKTNIGHLDAGAGAAGLIKAALILDRGVIPPTLHFATPNPQIDFAHSPFAVNATRTDWPRGPVPRRAGVSSFGIGGTNAHAVLEEAPRQESGAASRPWQLLVLSARTASALDTATANLARHLRAHPGVNLADVAHTLQSGRAEFEHRRIVVARDIDEAATLLEQRDPRRVFTGCSSGAAPGVVFLFPGQGAQYPGMTRELFAHEPVFREALQRCADLLRPRLDLLAALESADDATLTDTGVAQLAIFSVEYAFARLWESWGITPVAALGHSLGEYAAACLAGVLSLEDALDLIAERAQLMKDMPPGSMLAVRLSESELQPLLPVSVELAAINAPQLCVVSGPTETIATFATDLALRHIASIPLRTSHAFHSAMMEPAAAGFAALAASVQFQPPQLPLYSTLTGSRDADFARADYWSRQMREPVRFAAAAAAIPAGHVLLDVGPGATLSSPARQSSECIVVPSQRSSGEHEQCSMLEALGRLWIVGVPVDWTRLHRDERRLRVPLPTYPFERERYWLEPGSRMSSRPASAPPPKARTVDSQPTTSVDAVRALLHRLSGVAVEKLAPTATLLELGFDSLFLTQFAVALRQSFGIEITFRQLFEELSTIEAIAARIPSESVAQESTPAAPQSDEAPLPSGLIDTLTEAQRTHLTALLARYARRTANAKKHTHQKRAHSTELADFVRVLRSFVEEMEPWIAADAPPWEATPVTSAEEPLILPLTPSQRGLFALALHAPDAARAYNEPSALELRGPLDVVRLETALQELVHRHEALRTTISTDGSRQTIHPHAHVALPVVECADEAAVEAAIADVRAWCFDFTRVPMIDARLLRRGPEHHVLLVTLHHIFCNGPSLGVLCVEICALYTGEALPPAMQLRELVQHRLQPCAAATHAFWKAQFAQPPAPLALPADRPRPPQKTYHGGRESLTIDATLTASIRQAGAAHGASMFMTLLTAFQSLLHRLSGQDDVVVGVPFEGPERSFPGGDRLIAFSTNVMPLRSRLAGDTTFAELLEAQRSLVLEATAHQDYFVGDLVTALGLPFDASRSPLFDVFFNFESGRFERTVEDLQVALVNHDPAFLGLRGTSIGDLFLNITEHLGELHLRCDYNRDLFDPATIRRWLAHFQALLAGAVADTTQLVSRLALLPDEERYLVVEEWNRHTLPFPADATMHALFEQCVARQPNACALLDHGRRVTYRELNARADAIAAQLQALGVQREDFVGVCMQRSVAMIAALFGVLKAGAAYVPLDPAYPDDRLRVMLEDSQAKIVLGDAATIASHAPQLPAAQWVQPRRKGRPRPCTARGENVAYVIYTSGSTGRPKGVALEHRNAVSLIYWALDTFSPHELSGVLGSTSICFDVSIFEIFVTLSAGGTLVLAENVLELPRLPDADRVTLISTVPSAMGELVRGYDLPTSVHTVHFGGEVLPPALVEKLRRTGAVRRLINNCGPSETTTYSTSAEIFPGAPISIGRPIANTQCYILDPLLQPVPVGVTGEIYIGGAGVARGYLGRPELTAERFTPNPFGHSPRMYRSGDLGCWLPDGQILHRGRVDDQVKVRGFRVEPGEIDTALARHPAIREAVTISRRDSDGSTRLVAYLVPKAAPPAVRDLREHLRQRLPDYMVPSAFVMLTALPHTPSGKIDRRSLPEPDLNALRGAQEITEPRDAEEQRVAEIWREVLKVERLDVHDNFFDLGGHSLAAMQVASRVREAAHIEMNLLDVFERPTIAALAEVIREKNQPSAFEEGVL